MTRDTVQQLSGSSEMANVGHAGSNEDLIDLKTLHLSAIIYVMYYLLLSEGGYLRQELSVVGVIGTAQNGFLDLIHVDVDL